jgi:hypothetical protein
VQNTFYVEILGSVSERRFSLDELVMKAQELFRREGIGGFISLLLRLVDEKVSLEISTSGKNELMSCCANPKWEIHQIRKRTFRTTAGRIKIQWRRMKCRSCKRTMIPLREILGLQKHQSKTSELEKVVSDVIWEQSYRRTSRQLQMIGEIPVPKSTAHRWVMESNCDELNISEKPIEILVADGTAFKGRNLGKTGYFKGKGDLRVLLGITTEGDLTPLGSWAGRSWEEISQEISQQRETNTPLAKILLSDGELGLAEGLVGLSKKQQRCHWHQIRELRGTMWKDKAPLSEKKQMQKTLAAILALDLPNSEFEQISPEDEASIEQNVVEAEKKIDEMINHFISKKYIHAALFMQRAKKNLFTYIRVWLETGLACPRVSSWIERIMREIARRIKRIAFGWSNKGAAKMTRIIIKNILAKDQWQRYWENQFNVTGNVILSFRGVSID